MGYRQGTSLLNSHSSTSNSSGSCSNDKREKRDNSATSSGYSADLELSVTGSIYNPPDYIDLRDGCLKRKAVDPGCAKRRKLSEILYATSNVKADLARGGLPMPSIKADNPCNMVAKFGVDISKVTLKSASDVASSPFLINRKNEIAYGDEAYVMCKKLLIEAQKRYESTCTDVVASDKSDTDSSTSSFTSSESDNGNASAALTKTVLDMDTKKVKESVSIAPSRQSYANHPDVKPITMTQALKSANKPRLVTLAFQPFVVVHANAEFTRLTGLSSARVLGKPFRDVVAAESRKLLDASFSVFSLRKVHNIIINVLVEGNKQRECLLEVSLVAAECRQDDLSHFAIDISPIDLDTSNLGKSANLGKSTCTVVESSAPFSTGSFLVG